MRAAESRPGTSPGRHIGFVTALTHRFAPTHPEVLALANPVVYAVDEHGCSDSANALEYAESGQRLEVDGMKGVVRIVED